MGQLTNADCGEALMDEDLWSQKRAAGYLGVSPDYLRKSSCPKVILPGNGPKGKPLVKYDPVDVRAFKDRYRVAATTSTAPRRQRGARARLAPQTTHMRRAR